MFEYQILFKKKDIFTYFLTFISVTTTTAEALYEAVFEYCQSIKLDLENLLGIGTDGASNMCGNNNSLYTHLKTKLNLDNLV